MRVPADIRWLRVDDGVVIYDRRANLFVELNESGADVWSVFARGDDLDSASDRLVALYSLDQTVAAALVRDLVGQLTELGLLGPPSTGEEP